MYTSQSLDAKTKHLWDECLDMISQEITPTQFKAFFEPICFESFDKKTQILILQIPNKAFAEYLEGAFAPILSRALGSKFGPSVKLQYRVQLQPAAKRKSVVDEDNDKEADVTPVASNLNTQYTFNTFVEGASNKLARSIGMSIAEHPRSTKFNPMFVYGPSGCGKTHLINAIGLCTCSLYPKKKVLYVGAREFHRQYVEAQIIKNNLPELILFYQQFDMLIVDDVQEWENTPKAAETFFHIFNHLFMNGKRIILAADRTPAQLKNMDDRMLTRFACGVLTELEKPNTQLCLDILKAKVRRDNLSIPDDVMLYIAENANGSVRELEGVINSLLAFSMVYNNDIDMELAEKIVSRIAKETSDSFNINELLDIVCDYFGVDVEDVLGKTRKREIVIARQVAMYLCQKVGKINTTQIGRLVGKRDHSTVNHSIKLVAAQIEKDKKFAKQIKEIIAKLKGKK